MAPVVAIVNKESLDSKCGIGMRKATPADPIKISSISDDGLFGATDLVVGMQVLSINNIDVANKTSAEAIQILKDTQGQLVVVADATEHKRKCGYIILRKTFKAKEFSIATDKHFTFHGPMTDDMIDVINKKLNILNTVDGANTPQFKLDQIGHYKGWMNHDSQKHHEEDFIVMILEAMEEMGWYFRFQYDAESWSQKVMGGGSYSMKELFIFHRMP